MRALVVANPADRDPGLVGARLTELGWRLGEVDRERPAELPGLEGVDLVVSLGSDWSVYEPSVRSEVAAEAALLAAAHRRGVPVLGICWGAQVLAHALGGSVKPAPSPEVGWLAVRPTPGSPVPVGPWFQWHGDRFGVPPGARTLATSPLAPQAYVCGPQLRHPVPPRDDRGHARCAGSPGRGRAGTGWSATPTACWRRRQPSGTRPPSAPAGCSTGSSRTWPGGPGGQEKAPQPGEPGPPGLPRRTKLPSAAGGPGPRTGRTRPPPADPLRRRISCPPLPSRCRPPAGAGAAGARCAVRCGPRPARRSDRPGTG